MSISWGGYSGHLRVGIDAVISPANPSHSDTTVDVTWKYYVGTDGWNFQDPQVLHESADGWGGNADSFYNGLSSGSMLVGTHKETYGISYSSGSKSASANLTGAYNGASPSHSHTVNLPDRPKAAPTGGENPNYDTVTATSVRVTWQQPTDNGGAGIDNYQLQIADNLAYSPVAIDWTSGDGATFVHSVSGLKPNTKYYGRVRAHNSVGWGPYTSNSGGGNSFTTGAGTPSAPTKLTENAKTQTSITLGWAASSPNGGGTVTYTVDCSTSNTFPTGASTTTVTTTSTTYKFLGLSPGTTYYFRVRGSNSTGVSAESATLTVATMASAVYSDDGDYVTLVNNLASAVGDKLVHLGIMSYRYCSTPQTWTNNADHSIGMDSLVQFVGPDAPLHMGGGYTDLEIEYPGLYHIEYGVRFDESVASGHFFLGIAVNGVYNTSTTNPKAIGQSYFSPGNSAGIAGWRIKTAVVRLEAGDTIGYNVNQASGASMTQPTEGDGMYAYAKVALIGF